MSLDFFTPLVDGPEDFGAIAAANALSDLYAMRATPLLALNILAIPAGELSDEVVAGILLGAQEICAEAGVPVVGGHSIDDKEPKFGLVAIGLAHPDRLYRKSGARPGDAIVLGKALGTGTITTGIKRDLASETSAKAAIVSMRQLNADAVATLETFEVHAATDVTGFGLLGHLLEVCRASGVAATISATAPKRLPDVLELIEAGCVPGGGVRNRRAAERQVTYDGDVGETCRVLLNDPQTSGGLLVALPHADAGDLVSGLAAAGYAAAVIGRFEDAPESGEGPLIQVTP